MFYVIALAIGQSIRIVDLLNKTGSISADSVMVLALCFALIRIINRLNTIEGIGDEEKEVVPNRPHPLARPQRARPSVPALPDK